MLSLALLCTDGSDVAQRALAAGLAVIQPTDRRRRRPRDETQRIEGGSSSA